MTLYFAYGANMERAAMRRRCTGARALGPASLRGWRYVIVDGYGSVAPAAGCCVFGVLWRLTPRDLAALNAFESLDSGLYRRALLTVDTGRQRTRALVYVGRREGSRRPRPGYQERLVAAAEDWRLPPRYIAQLRRLAPGYRGARAAETGEIG
ncbi:MAG: gamma-glutamylcyclotransferase [Alphaproteobacteria bacterium]|nr:MAG: gamma-glutamylcyclotransferase [Alphaproteobacteria bacterium]